MSYSLQPFQRVSGRLKRLFNPEISGDMDSQNRPRLLVVDDEESVCFSISDYLGQHGYTVDTASNFEEAQSLIESNEYKVIIQDLRLGTAAARNLAGLAMIRLAHLHNPHTRIIVLTAYGSPETEAEARRCGASAFLLKPKPLPVVAQVIHGLI